MVPIPLALRIGFSSKDPMASSKVTSFGRLRRKINAKSSYGSLCRKITNGGEPAKKGDDLTKITVCCAMAL
jgi:hypothetical protein